MGQPHIERSSERLLLNAESFGFGPAAAIAAMFPHLRERFEHIGFVGTGHTLDLQQALPYNEIHDLTGLSESRLAQEVKRLSAHYDVFFTAMDFPMLERFKSEAISTSGFDALTWYWKELPEGAKQSDLYLAQNFFGVEKRINDHRDELPKSFVVPPPIHEVNTRQEDRDIVLVNLGGLLNPFWRCEDAVLYAEKMVSAIRSVLPEHSNVVIATSQSIARELGGLVKTYPREEMCGILAKTKYAFMTPGMGNIYDAAAYNIPTLWLPPANDSQGQQLMLLAEHQLSDAEIDWSKIGGRIQVPYRAEQTVVMSQIQSLVQNTPLQDIRAGIISKLGAIQLVERSRCCELLTKFGTGGDKIIAEHIFNLAEGNL